MSLCNAPGGEALVLIAGAVALQLGQGKAADALALMATFFTALGDNLALIAARRAVTWDGVNECAENPQNPAVPIDNPIELV